MNTYDIERTPRGYRVKPVDERRAAAEESARDWAALFVVIAGAIAVRALVVALL
ncbi:hypothetical protein D3C73_1592570 [compost metagenome]